MKKNLLSLVTIIFGLGIIMSTNQTHTTRAVKQVSLFGLSDTDCPITGDAFRRESVKIYELLKAGKFAVALKALKKLVSESTAKWNKCYPEKAIKCDKGKVCNNSAFPLALQKWTAALMTLQTKTPKGNVEATLIFDAVFGRLGEVKKK